MMLVLCILTCLAGGITIHLGCNALEQKRYFLFGFNIMMSIMDVILITVYIITEFM